MFADFNGVKTTGKNKKITYIFWTLQSKLIKLIEKNKDQSRDKVLHTSKRQNLRTLFNLYTFLCLTQFPKVFPEHKVFGKC